MIHKVFLQHAAILPCKDNKNALNFKAIPQDIFAACCNFTLKDNKTL
jgi:hypothetical protein